MDWITLLLFIVGIVLLVAGAELLVRGASRLALALRVSPLVIGLTIVAYGTSSPELAVSTVAALHNQADIALGNVVGSNIFNVLVILGISAAITPLIIHQQIIRLDVPVMIGVSALTFVFALDGRIQRWEGLVLVIGAVAYTILVVWLSRRETKSVQEEYSGEFGESEAPGGAKSILWQLLLIAIGLGMLGLGSRWLVDGAISLARYLGVSELVIGLTIVATGTSLPEVAASVAAALKGERDIAVGNVVGSNIFNLLLVLGAAAGISNQGIVISQTALHFDLPVMIAVAAVCLPVFMRGFNMQRWEGLLFLAYYIAYVSFLALKGQNNPRLELFSNAMLYAVLPLSGLTVLISFVVWRARQRRAS
ncbi:MAG: calcium/sodium antiporter [Leptospirales bacterium]|nr:calcium/sodium antiporter [Leptospirales bacterium]